MVNPPAKPITERRQLTVMFCDLADSTGLAQTLDPEDMRDVVQSYQRTAERVVQRYDGFIAQYLGDGLMVYFGYPIAHEDDPIRAAYTALELPIAIDNLNIDLQNRFGIQLSVRTGVSTGEVVIGHIGSDSGSDALATGVTPNEAAHLQALADRNSNVISAKTRELVGDRFILENIGEKAGHADNANHRAHDVVGDVFRIVAENDAESRFAATKKYYYTDMVGRADQLQQLKSLWTGALKGESKAVLISGEAGIGKSRMVQSLFESLHEHDYHRIIYQCSPYHTDSPFYPAAQQLAFAAKLSATNSDEEKRSRIETMLEPLVGNTDDAIALLSPLLNLNCAKSSSERIEALSAQEKRDASLEMFLELLSALAKVKPVLFVLEDAHWIDATTQTLLDMAIARSSGQKALILLTARPEYLIEESEHIEVIELPRLDQRAVEQVVSQLGNHKSIPDIVVRKIVNQTDGVPLFVEELTRTLLDSNMLVETDSDYELSGELADVYIPATLQDSLMARIDKLDGAKEFAQVAACIGRQFEKNDIANISDVNALYLKSSLSKLEAAQLISKNSEQGYTFKHALVRDVAYASLTKSRRKTIHRDLFDYFETVGRQSEVLAFHATEAGLTQVAMEQWSNAATSAIERAAYREAIAHLDKAIVCSHQMESNDSLRAKELELLVQQGHASTALKGFAHPDTVAINVKARALLNQVKESPYRYPVLYGHWVINFAVGQHPSALIDANEMYEEASSSNDRVKRIIAYRALASSQTMMGEFQEADRHLAKVIDLYDVVEDKELAWKINLDPTVPGRIYGAICKTCMGDGDGAAQLTQDVEQFAMQLGHSHTIIYMLSHMALASQIGRWDNREYYIDQTRKFVDQHDLMAYLGHALGIEAMMLYEKGELDVACDTMQRSLEVITKTKTHIYSPLLYANYAANLADLGRFDEAESAASTALAMSTQNKEYWARAEILRLLAHTKHVQLRSGRQISIESIEAQLGDSVALADSQGAHMWSLRSATSVAELQHEMGKSKQAYSYLQAKLKVYPSTGQSQQDWKMANSLLDKLHLF